MWETELGPNRTIARGFLSLAMWNSRLTRRSELFLKKAAAVRGARPAFISRQLRLKFDDFRGEGKRPSGGRPRACAWSI